MKLIFQESEIQCNLIYPPPLLDWKSRGVNFKVLKKRHVGLRTQN